MRKIWCSVRIRARWIVVGVAGAAGALAVGIYAATHTNSAPITINDVSTATPYASTIVVSGEGGLVTDVNVTLTNVSHPFTDDVDILLEAPPPGGAKTILMSDAGDGVGVSGINLTFDDAAPLPIADESAPATGTYKPTNYGLSAAPACSTEPDPDVFPMPAPAGPYSASLSTFNGPTSPNGTWSLYVVDDCGGDAGSIAQGWSITITATPTAVHVRDFTGQAVPGRVVLRWRTGSETEVLGFNVHRSSRAGKVRVNRTLIAAKPSVAGAAYRLVDRRVRPGISYTYRLQIVARDGLRSSAGLVALRAR